MSPAALLLGFAFNIICLSVFAVIAMYALHLSIKTQIEMGALKNSTHNVQFVPVDDMPGADDDDANKKIRRGEEDAMDALNDDVDDLLHQRGNMPL